MNRRLLGHAALLGAMLAAPLARASILNFSARELQVLILISSPKADAAHEAAGRLDAIEPGAAPLGFDDAGGSDHPCWTFDYLAPGRRFHVPQSTMTVPVRVSVTACEGAPEPGGYGLFGDAVLYVSPDPTPAPQLAALKKALVAPHDTGLAEVDSKALAKGEVKTTPMAPYVPKALPPFVVYSTADGAKKGFAGDPDIAVVVTGPGSSLSSALDAAVDRALANARAANAKMR